MKRLISLLLVLAVLIPAAAMAGNRSELVSEKDLKRIEIFAQNVYDWKGEILMTVEDDWPLYRFFVIEFRGRHDWQYVSFDVYPASVAFRNHRIGCIEMKNATEEIERFIKEILNTSARQALR